MNNRGRWAENPADWEGVEVFRPKKLLNTTYDDQLEAVTDLDTGHKLMVSYSSGHGTGPRQFAFYASESICLGRGTYRDFGLTDK